MTAKTDRDSLVLRDQQRALHAYACVSTVSKDWRVDYKIAVNDLGANILRGGLCAAIAEVQRLGKRGQPLLAHLAASGIPGLEGVSGAELFPRIRNLNADAYMIATREMLAVAKWLKRASQGLTAEAGDA